MTGLEAALHLLCLACTYAAFAGCLYLAFAALVVSRSTRRAAPPIRPYPSVSILKPLHGDEPGLERRLLSFAAQRYEGAVQLVFGFRDRDDHAIPVAREIAVFRGGHTTDIVVDDRSHGGNRKVSNLLHCYERARHEVIVLADSDIEVDPDYLRTVVEALATPGVGAVTCLYEGEGTQRGARLSAQAINAHFIPNVLVGIALGAATPCFGSTIALRRETLERIGGFQAVADKLADDYAIGDGVRHLGLRVAVLPFAVRHACAEPTFAAFFAHQLRFARTIRSIDPLGHAGSFVTNPLPLALVAALEIPAAWWLVAASLACRAIVLRTVARRFAMAPQPLWLIPFCDVALVAVHVASFCGSAVEWRGHRFRSLSDGSLAPEKDPTPA